MEHETDADDLSDQHHELSSSSSDEGPQYRLPAGYAAALGGMARRAQEEVESHQLDDHVQSNESTFAEMERLRAYADDQRRIREDEEAAEAQWLAEGSNGAEAAEAVEVSLFSACCGDHQRDVKEPDALQRLNDELRGQADAAAGPWLPLESNPEVFTTFAHRIGLSKQWAFEDVLGIDPELLSAMFPVDSKPVAAVILLFPCTKSIYMARRREAGRLCDNVGRVADDRVFHLEQVSSFGNACGTIAAVHAVTNAAVSLDAGVPVAQFKAETQNSSRTDRGHALLTTSALKAESDSAAAHHAAQTACPDRDGPDLDHHYCAFVPIVMSSGATHVVELDGTKICAVDHGPLPAGASFVRRPPTSCRPRS